jgi:Zn-dependent protease/predicted transcriptional regulator
MRTGFRIGRLLGIDVHIDWSWLLIFFLITWNLSAVFMNAHPGWRASVTWATAFLAALLFFGSVLAHEMAHSLVARARGIPVRNITLFLFGGVSSIQREPESPGSEFLVAIVGPLTSLLLGALLLGIAAAIAGPIRTGLADPALIIRQLSPMATLLLWLGSINVTLAVFNMVPGFPLDGGRVLRSLLWAATGSLRRATRWASWVGQSIAWLMILAGIGMIFGAQIPFLGTGFINGLWLAFIGWFLSNAALQSYHQVVLRDVLEGVPVRRLMRTAPPTCQLRCTVSKLVHEHVMGSDDYAFPVLDDARLVGIVTLDDVRRVPRNAWELTYVRDIMTPAAKLIVASPDEDAAEALNKLAQHDVRQLPVLSGGEFVGLFRRRDVLRWLQLQSDDVRPDWAGGGRRG